MQYSVGRARRKEFWYFVLFNMIFALVAWGLDNVLGINFEGMNYGWIYLIYVLATILPNLGVAIRRLHDIGKRGWWILIELIPLVGSIWLIVLFAKERRTRRESIRAGSKTGAGRTGCRFNRTITDGGEGSADPRYPPIRPRHNKEAYEQADNFLSERES